MALFMITLHNKGVLTGGKNTLITVLFTIFVPALFLTGTHATLQARRSMGRCRCWPGELPLMRTRLDHRASQQVSSLQILVYMNGEFKSYSFMLRCPSF